MKKYLELLNREELTKVYEANEKLRAEVLEDMIDSEMYYIGEKLDYVRDSLRDWSVGACQRSYVQVNDSSLYDFLEGMKKMDSEVPAFSEKKAAAIIGKLEEAVEAYYAAEDEEDDEAYENAREAAEEAAREAADALAEQFDDDLNGLYGHDTGLCYFLEFYAENRMDERETYYILPEEGTYQLYEDVSYTKSY